MIPPRDTSGELIEVHDRVAYNMSGKVVLGTVEEISISYRRQQWSRYVIYVRNEQHGNLSKVHNPDGIVVLEKA